MKAVLVYLLFVVSLSLATCGDRPRLDFVDKAICATGSAVKPDYSAVIPPEDGVVRVQVLNGRSKAVIKKESGQTVYVEFKSEGYSRLYGNLYSKDKQANIRFCRIITPGGVSEGPFLKDIEYDLLHDGVYRLAINENIITGSPWSGDMKVQLVFGK